MSSTNEFINDSSKAAVFCRGYLIRKFCSSLKEIKTIKFQKLLEKIAENKTCFARKKGHVSEAANIRKPCKYRKAGTFEGGDAHR